MKILFPYMARWSSAHASRYYHLLTQVAELGHDVYVLQPPSRGSGEANDIDVDLPTHPRVHVTTVPFGRRFWNASFAGEKLLKKMLYSVRSRTYVRQLIKDEAIDLLYLYNLPQFLYLIGTRPKVVFDFADDLLGMLQSELSISRRHPVYRLASFCLNWIIRRSDFVICISGPLYDKVRHSAKFIIPNGANILANSNGYSLPQNAVTTVGYVGAFEYSMALDQAVDAAERLPECKFVLIGAGREFPRIQQVVKARGLSNVLLTGAVSHREAMKFVSSMDICLNLFAKTEVSHAVSPLKLFEYLSFRKPVISTRLLEVERVDKGFLYYADNVDEIVDRVKYIVSHWEEVAQRAEHGYETVVEEFNWTKIANDFVKAAATTGLGNVNVNGNGKQLPVTMK